MKLVNVLLFLSAITLCSVPVRAQGRECVAGVSDLSEMILCLKDVHRPLLEKCEKPPESGWSAPVEGRRVMSFGDKTQYGSVSKGIVYETEHGERARAPVAGIVLHADEFRSYGKLVILDACGVEVLIAGLSTISVRSGETVQQSAEIGTMAPAAGRAEGPILYLEVRDSGQPVDPSPFLR